MTCRLKMPKHKRSDEAVARRKEIRLAVSVEILLRCKLAGTNPPVRDLPVPRGEVFDYLHQSRLGEFVECQVKEPDTEQSSGDHDPLIG